MDDLLREIKKLSAHIKEERSESTSSKEEATNQPTSAKKVAKKRQKNRRKKHKGRKRRLKYIADFEADSSSFTDCTDEDIIRDYIANITADLSDSDVDSALRKGAFLMKRDLASSHDFGMPVSPEVDETDSFSESFRLTHSRKKRRRYKRHCVDGIDHQLNHVNSLQRKNIHDVLSKQFSKSSKAAQAKKLKLEDENEETMEVEPCRDSSQANSTSDNSDSSSNTPGSEADDEGEESSLESSTAIQPVIPWWDDEQPTEVDMSAMDGDKNEVAIEQSLDLMRDRSDFKTRFLKTSGVLFCESGGFVAYANHKVRNFVLHRDPNELSLYTTSKKEQNQVHQLAVLYNLQCNLEDAARCSKVVLTKTLSTAEPNQEDLKSFLSKEVKLRCRKNRPLPQWNHKRRKVTVVGENNGFTNELMDFPIPDSNVGNQMLRTMGWKPGQGLGKDSCGMKNPIKPIKRPRHLGFGHPDVT